MLSRRYAARAGMLDNSDRRAVELGHALERRVGVVQVVVGQLLALHLHRRRDPASLARYIERRRLMRILTVAQRLPQDARNGHAFGEQLLTLLREPFSD